MAKNKKAAFTYVTDVAYDAVFGQVSQDIIVKSFFAEAWVDCFAKKSSEPLELVELAVDSISTDDYTAKLFIKFKHVPVGVTFAIRESDGKLGSTLIKVGKRQAMHLEFPSRTFIDLKGSVLVTPVTFTITPTVILKKSPNDLPQAEPLVEKFVVINPEYSNDKPIVD